MRWVTIGRVFKMKLGEGTDEMCNNSLKLSSRSPCHSRSPPPPSIVDYAQQGGAGGALDSLWGNNYRSCIAVVVGTREWTVSGLSVAHDLQFNYAPRGEFPYDPVCDSLADPLSLIRSPRQSLRADDGAGLSSLGKSSVVLEDKMSTRHQTRRLAMKSPRNHLEFEGSRQVRRFSSFHSICHTNERHDGGAAAQIHGLIVQK